MNLLPLLRLLLALVCVLGVAGAAPDNAPNYVLRPNDGIRLEVYGEPDLSGSVRILKSGQASFPLIGEVEVAGLTVTAAKDKIRELYAKDFLVDPKMTLTVDDYATDYVSVIGAVTNPGQVPIPMNGHLDLAAAMASVGGLAAEANPDAIQLVRAGGGSTYYSKSAIEGGAAGRVKLAAGDRIIVSQSSFVGKKVTVLGAVGRPGPVGFPIDGSLDLVSAIAYAGGMTGMSNEKKVKINRKGTEVIVDYREISQRADRPYKLQPGDIITVEKRIF